MQRVEEKFSLGGGRGYPRFGTVEKAFSSVSAFRPDIPSLSVLAGILLRELYARFFSFLSVFLVCSVRFFSSSVS
jgi:hypothetical protein